MITILSLTNFHATQFLAKLASLTAVVFVFAMASVANAQQSFKTTEEAAYALVNAVRSSDRKGILTVLGRDGADVVSSGDPVADAAARQRVLEAYDAKHQVILEGADKATLFIGQEAWPFPIPLVRKHGAWRFDTVAGREEILVRRIGRNELSAIQTCLAFVDGSTNMPRRASPGTASTHSASSAGGVQRMACIGPRNPARARARSASSPPVLRRRGTESASSASPITATTTGFSPGRGRTRQVAHSTTSCAAR
jgi:Protein of unknown function (DUF2950)